MLYCHIYRNILKGKRGGEISTNNAKSLNRNMSVKFVSETMTYFR